MILGDIKMLILSVQKKQPVKNVLYGTCFSSCLQAPVQALTTGWSVPCQSNKLTFLVSCPCCVLCHITEEQGRTTLNLNGGLLFLLILYMQLSLYTKADSQLNPVSMSMGGNSLKQIIKLYLRKFRSEFENHQKTAATSLWGLMEEGRWAAQKEPTRTKEMETKWFINQKG